MFEFKADARAYYDNAVKNNHNKTPVVKLEKVYNTTDWGIYFTYDAELGVLRNKITRSSNAKKGDVAGGHAAKNSRYILGWLVDGKQTILQGARIIWVMHHGPIPEGMEIDHIDRDPSNNHLDNLRLVSRLQNMANSGMHRTNKSGICESHRRCSGRSKAPRCGVSEYHNGPYTYWRASIAVTRHTVTKRIAKAFKTQEEAIAQREEWEQVRDILNGMVAWVIQEEWDMVYASKYWEVYHGMAQEQDEDYGM